jgi:hypothetical protein
MFEIDVLLELQSLMLELYIGSKTFFPTLGAVTYQLSGSCATLMCTLCRQVNYSPLHHVHYLFIVSIAKLISKLWWSPYNVFDIATIWINDSWIDEWNVTNQDKTKFQTVLLSQLVALTLSSSRFGCCKALCVNVLGASLRKSSHNSTDQ